MSAKQALMTSTNANMLDTSSMPTLTGFAVTQNTPAGTDTRFVLRTDGSWQKYDTNNKAWVNVATQALTAVSVMAEGNTAAELNAVPASAMTGFVNKSIYFAAALQTENVDVMPNIQSVTVKGESGSTVTKNTVDCGTITLNKSTPVDIVNIAVDTKETGSGKVTVYASIKTADGVWSDYRPYTDFLGMYPTQAMAIAFRVKFDVVNVGKDAATLNSIEVTSRADNVSMFSAGTSVCITKTYDFKNIMTRAHLIVKHREVPDTKISAQLSLRMPSTTVKNELLGTGDNKQHTVKLKNVKKLASHGFHLYFDGVEQKRDTYSYSPIDGQVTYTAGNSVTVTADYIYDWTSEKWVDMTYDNSYPDKNDASIIAEQFDYMATSDDMPKGSIGTVRITMVQESGTITDKVLGTGTGSAVSYPLEHHAVNNKIKVTPESATWQWKDITDYLVVTAPAGETVKVTYDWVARPLSLDSLVCVFDE